MGEINSFLGLSTLQFDNSTFEPGVLLAVLCILLWNLCIYREFRSIWFVLQGIFLSSGSEGPAPTGQRAVAMAFVCLGRAAIGGSLLVAGSLWLAGTTSITELMLNSVALEAVLHVDEFIFSGLLPTQLQQQIQELPPVKVRRARRCHRAENLVLASCLGASLLLPYALLLRPLSQQARTTEALGLPVFLAEVKGRNANIIFCQITALGRRCFGGLSSWKSNSSGWQPSPSSCLGSATVMPSP